MNFISQNWPSIIGVVGTIGTIGFGILSVILYLRSIQKPIPKYVIDPLRVQIVDKSKAVAPGLEILHKGELIMAPNVTAATIYFWNAGHAAIRRSDILQAFTVRLDRTAEVLDIAIVNMTRPVCKFTLTVPVPQRDETQIGFDVMEQGDGVTVQCIYAGKRETRISISGVTVGAADVTELELAEASTGATAGIVEVLLFVVFLGFSLESNIFVGRYISSISLAVAVTAGVWLSVLLVLRSKRRVPVRLRQPR